MFYSIYKELSTVQAITKTQPGIYTEGGKVSFS